MGWDATAIAQRRDDGLLGHHSMSDKRKNLLTVREELHINIIVASEKSVFLRCYHMTIIDKKLKFF